MEPGKLTLQELENGEILKITLGPPPANIIDFALINQLENILTAENKPDKSPRKLIWIEGNGKNFSFGASIHEHLPPQVDKLIPAFHQLVLTLLDHPIVTISSVRGKCLGGAWELVLATTFNFCAEKSLMGCPEINLGVFPPPASLLLPEMVPVQKASEWLLSGSLYPPEEFLSWGLVNKIFPEEKLEEGVLEFFHQNLKAKSASSLRIAHRAIRWQQVKKYQEGSEGILKLYLSDLMSSQDSLEGLNSFIEKRKPVWKNH